MRFSRADPILIRQGYIGKGAPKNHFPKYEFWAETTVSIPKATRAKITHFMNLIWRRGWDLNPCAREEHQLSRRTFKTGAVVRAWLPRPNETRRSGSKSLSTSISLDESESSISNLTVEVLRSSRFADAGKMGSGLRRPALRIWASETASILGRRGD